MTEPLIMYSAPTRPWGMPDMSPFAIKLETYLRMTEQRYEKRQANFRDAPKGKVPYVEIDGRLIGDSQLIIETLESRRPVPLDAWLSETQSATAHAVRRMLEEGLYFVGVYGRWQDDAGFEVLQREFKKLLPPPARLLMPLIRKRVMGMLYKQGTGRHSADEIWNFGKKDLAVVSTILGQKKYLLGDQPCVSDATLYGFLEAILGFPVNTPLKNEVQSRTNLIDYHARMKTAYFSDLG